MQTQIILHILLCLGLIIIATKWCSVMVQKVGLPSVVGMIIAGLLLKILPIFSNFDSSSVSGVAAWDVKMASDKFISYVAELGVVMIMFSAGLGTNLRQLVHSGAKATVVAAAGVLTPLVLGCAMALLFWKVSPNEVGGTFESTAGGVFGLFKSRTFLEALFIGTILTATSVSITVATLKELGVINSTVGQTIVSAAIIDDVMGIVVLTIVIGVAGGEVNVIEVLVKTLLFFIASGVVGFLLYHIFKWYDGRHEHTRRIAIYGLGTALIMSYCAEKFFGIADITGAYIAGVIFCNLRDARYMEEKIDVNSYMLFSPVFFASIGLKTTLAGLNMQLLLFSLLFVIVGCAAKVIGSGGVSRLLGFRGRSCLQIGVGMMVRGEVALIVAQKGLASGLVDRRYFTSVILLIIVSSMVAPVLLKMLFKKDASQN